MFTLATIILVSLVITLLSAGIAVILMDVSEWAMLFNFIHRLSFVALLIALTVMVVWVFLNGLGISIEVNHG